MQNSVITPKKVLYAFLLFLIFNLLFIGSDDRPGFLRAKVLVVLKEIGTHSSVPTGTIGNSSSTWTFGNDVSVTNDMTADSLIGTSGARLGGALKFSDGTSQSTAPVSGSVSDSLDTGVAGRDTLILVDATGADTTIIIQNGTTTVIKSDNGFSIQSTPFAMETASNPKITVKETSGSEAELTSGGAASELKSSTDLRLRTDGSLRICVTSAGNTGIGSDTSPDYYFDVQGQIHSDDLNGGAINVTADANGNLIRDPSDIKFKTNISNIEDALQTILQLKGRKYDWKDRDYGSINDYGLVAQEVAVVNKNLTVSAEYMSVKQQAVIAYLVEAMKEQQKQIDELTKQKRKKFLGLF